VRIETEPTRYRGAVLTSWDGALEDAKDSGGDDVAHIRRLSSGYGAAVNAVAPADTTALRLNHPFNPVTQGSRSDNPGL